MTLKEKLGNLVLAGIAALALNGCSDEQYHFNGRIEGEQVVFWEEEAGSNHYLKVKRTDGTVITYADRDIFFDLEKITIQSPTGMKKEYTRAMGYPKMFEEAKTQYLSYLAKILKAKTKEGLEALKGNLY